MAESRLFPPLGEETRRAMDALGRAVDEAAPLKGQARRFLPDRIREVWKALTSEREGRDPLYLARPEFSSAYLRYFFPWNVYRFVRLFTALVIDLADGAVVVDLGSGPLTVIIALWIAKPALRDRKLTVYAVDRAGASMEAGASAFERIAVDLSGTVPAWRIVRVKERFGAAIKEKADLVTAAFMINELSDRNRGDFASKAQSYLHTIRGYAKRDGRILFLEPGVPRSGAMLSALRDKFLESGASIIAPCPHDADCPMPGPYHKDIRGGEESETGRLPRRPYGAKKTPWCHFVFDSAGAPEWLVAISKEAKLEKEDAALSFLYARLSNPISGGTTDQEGLSDGGESSVKGDTKTEIARVVSGEFPLPDGSEGRYVCVRKGYTLMKTRLKADLKPGDLVLCTCPRQPEKDAKTGAPILYGPGFTPDMRATPQKPRRRN